MLSYSHLPCHFIYCSVVFDTLLKCITKQRPFSDGTFCYKKFFFQVATLKGHSLTMLLSQGCICSMPQHSQSHNRSLEKIKHWIIQCFPSWHSCEMCIQQHQRLDNMYVFQFLLEQEARIYRDALLGKNFHC